MACVLAALLALPAGAHALSVRVEADKPRYEDGETARLTVTVTNESGRPATDVNIANLLPEGLRYAPEQGETAFRHEVIAPRESVRHTLLVQRDPRVSVRESGGVRVTVMRDKDAYAPGETARLTVVTENLTNLPIRNVRLANLLPEGLRYAPEQEQTAYEDELVRPHDSVTHVFLVRQAVVDVPMTGDGFRPLGALGGTLLSAAAFALLMQRRKTQSNRQGEENG